MNEKIYVIQLKSFITNFNLIYRLLKTLYNFKQIFKMWYKIIKKILKLLKFISTNFDINVFVFNDKKIYIVVYMNDLLIIKLNLNFINNLKKNNESI